MKKMLFMFCLVTIAAIGEPNNPRTQNDNKYLEKYNKWIDYLLKNGVPVHNDHKTTKPNKGLVKLSVVRPFNDHQTTTPHKGLVKLSVVRPFNDHKTTTPHKGVVKICFGRPVSATTEGYHYHDEVRPVTAPEQTFPDECYYDQDPTHNEYSYEDLTPEEVTTTASPCKPFHICSIITKPIEITTNAVTGALTTTRNIISYTAKTISNAITSVCDWFGWR